ncbi:fimbrial biogenesis outer membrane usher protein [Vibrio parahaemolyticus]|nr:fimbrial biogenesis outer membrane usher protein [Vibrio parahaemolyticus]RXP52721.1 fimbrial biogenesis outer membrane usher protein [Vibrio parahaemolyticus]RXP65370.1 fimbrial biogenesis outer membrane usher protein [Vibrio parahaemolyticus]RXP70699.1 fimbrial biogenesis outer membrane usher protein [Vibrio parahaemolyticus]RXP92317.1 fimbrial biogenesis outer membrane usher protein [Vibrio parahaemolyticus]
MYCKNTIVKSNKNRMYILVILFTMSKNTNANLVEDFNTELLFDVNTSALLEYRNDSYGEIKGYYDIYINNDFLFSDDIYIYDGVPCISEHILDQINIENSFKDLIRLSASLGKSGCYTISSDLIKSEVESNSLILRFLIPQSKIKKSPRNYVDSSEFEFGDNGLYINYSANKYWVESDSGYNSTDHLSINSSINYKGWYLRHSGNYNENKYKASQTYVTRIIPEVESAVKFGSYSTSGRLFSTIPMIGLAIENKSEMLPPSRQGFAPSIRGTASTTAVVTVDQNEIEIYRETVPPGDFIINDLYPMGFGSDLMVTILESDGTERKFRVVYNPTTRMIRPEQIHQNFYFGRTDIGQSDMSVMEYDVEYGINNLMTIYGGLQASTDYYSQLAGISFGTFLGGISIDVTNSNSKFANWINGQSYNLNWAKHIDATNSDITFSAFKYSTKEYYNLRDYVQNADYFDDAIGRTKGSLAISFNQNLGNVYGSLYANINQRNFWNVDTIERQYQVGYSNSWKRVNYSLSINRNERDGVNNDTSFLFNVNFPLYNHRSNISSPTVTLSLQDREGYRSERLGVNGVYGENSEVSYGISAQNSNSSGNTALNGYISYNNPFVNMNLTYSNNDSNDAYSLGLRGAIVAWNDGVAFTSQQSDTYAIAHIDDVPDAIINNNSSQITDIYGNAVISGLYPYRRNKIIVNDKLIDDNITIKNGSSSIVPIRGSISLINFDSEYKYNIILYINSQETLLFGTPIYYNKSNEIVGYIGQNNKALLNLIHPQGTITIGNEFCVFNYDINTNTKKMVVNCD